MFRSLRASARRTKRVAAALTAALALAVAPAPAMAAPGEIGAMPIKDWMPEQGDPIFYPEPAPKCRVIHLPGKWPLPPVKVIIGVC